MDMEARDHHNYHMNDHAMTAIPMTCIPMNYKSLFAFSKIFTSEEKNKISYMEVDDDVCQQKTYKFHTD